MSEEMNTAAPESGAGADVGAVAEAAPAPTGAAAAPAAPQFLDMLSEEQRVDPTFGKFKSVEEIAKSYKNLEGLVGADKNSVFRIPKDGDLSEVYQTLGRPAEASDYKTDAFENEILKPLMQDERINKYKEIMHEEGVSDKAYNRIMEAYAAEAIGDITGMTEQRQAAIADNAEKNKAMLGGAYEERIAQIDAIQAKYGGEEFGQVVDQYPEVFTHPAVVKLFSEIAPQFSEDAGFKGGQSTGGRMTPAEANMAIATFEGDIENVKALMNTSHPKHNAVKAERDKLWAARKQANG